jgi:hypothetical protein
MLPEQCVPEAKIEVRHTWPRRANYAPCAPAFACDSGLDPPAATLVIVDLVDPAITHEIEGITKSLASGERLSRDPRRHGSITPSFRQ